MVPTRQSQGLNTIIFRWSDFVIQFGGPDLSLWIFFHVCFTDNFHIMAERKYSISIYKIFLVI